MYDNHGSFTLRENQPFEFVPQRYELWKNKKMVASGNTNLPIIAKVVKLDNKERMEINFSDSSLFSELTNETIFDIFKSSGDRLKLLILPEETNPSCIGIEMERQFTGLTRLKKNFKANEPYCCSIYTISQKIVKITFSFSNPEKLLEFYKD